MNKGSNVFYFITLQVADTMPVNIFWNLTWGTFVKNAAQGLAANAQDTPSVSAPKKAEKAAVAAPKAEVKVAAKAKKATTTKK